MYYFSVNILRQNKIGNYSSELIDFDMEQKQRLKNYEHKIKPVIQKANRFTMASNSKKLSRHTTYEQLIKVNQGIIINEASL